jgi:hypothetical protein
MANDLRKAAEMALETLETTWGDVLKDTKTMGRNNTSTTPRH